MHAVTALFDRQPTSQLCEAISDFEEGNDGDVFRTVRYETTFLRRGYVLVPQAVSSPETGAGVSPPDPSASEDVSQPRDGRCPPRARSQQRADYVGLVAARLWRL